MADAQQREIAEQHTAKVIGVTVAAAVGGFLFGFDSSVVNAPSTRSNRISVSASS